MAGQQPILFSGSAADMLKSMGKDVPETKEQSSLEASRAAKAAMEEPCHDPHCTREARARATPPRARAKTKREGETRSPRFAASLENGRRFFPDPTGFRL